MKEQKEDKKNLKCFVVLVTLDRDAREAFGIETAYDFQPIKIFASEIMAKSYCETRAQEWARIAKFSSAKIHWLNDYTLVCDVEDYFNAQRWEIHGTVIDDAVPSDFHYPQIEKENEVLRNECYRLRKELADVTQRNAVAATYATMWDGGRDYTKERVLDNLHAVKDVLAGDHAKVLELFEAWKKTEENK